MERGPTEPKTTSAMRPPRWLFVGFLLGLYGCPSVPTLGSYIRNGIGISIDKHREAESRPNIWDDYKAKIGWKETTYQLDNGNWVWVEVDSKDCFIHWEVNPQGIVVGAHTEGNGCRSGGVLFGRSCITAGVGKCP